MSQTVWTLWDQGDLVGIYSQQADAETEAENRRTTLHEQSPLPARRIEVVPHHLFGTKMESNPAEDNDDEDGEQEAAYLPWTTLTLDEARRKLSALHFVKEALSVDEKRILFVAEALLRLIDDSGARPSRREPQPQRHRSSRAQDAGGSA